MSYATQRLTPWDLLGEGKAKRKERERPRGGGGRGAPKLTDEQVRAIRASHKSPSELGREYGIDRHYACRVQHGDTHRHVR